MVRRLGIKIHVIPAINVKHIGQHIFEGCFFCATGTQIHTLDGQPMEQKPEKVEKKEEPKYTDVYPIEWKREELP